MVSRDMVSRDIGRFSTTRPAQHRIDGFGARVVLLPAHCVLGKHVLAVTGYTATLTTDQVLRVSCSVCALSGVDSRWFLDASDEAARAEFSATAYPSPATASPR
ncbi:hypothetical protein NLX83_22415 [Allokutzneria sp. A3M-2-11 16]|uniref:hypothetical protein n=1 Tax=Allokutzneria sp. A3M-2-11 16 TaxID=2962043 RepID=UPI0020B7259B|nr:hypothetical protein [Allokutzneria sp. A3M-2-11 16]MCP3802024.1 hypothetical protein [Allokutzneria sp. A3M-2-11 16]